MIIDEIMKFRKRQKYKKEARKLRDKADKCRVYAAIARQKELRQRADDFDHRADILERWLKIYK